MKMFDVELEFDECVVYENIEAPNEKAAQEIAVEQLIESLKVGEIKINFFTDELDPIELDTNVETVLNKCDKTPNVNCAKYCPLYAICKNYNIC